QTRFGYALRRSPRDPHGRNCVPAKGTQATMSLVFYYSPFTSATTTHWALEELGIPYEKKKIDFKLDTKKPDFLKMNPNGKVPLLVHDGTPIFESTAIIAYLGETFGVEKKLFPAPGPQRGQALMWM